MPSHWIAVDHLVQELGDLRKQALAVRLDRTAEDVALSIERALTEAARAVDATIDGPEDDQLLVAACDAIVVARERIEALKTTMEESRQVVARSQELRRAAARLLYEAIKRSPAGRVGGVRGVVLIVEDAEDDREAYAHFLASNGMGVVKAAEGEEGLRIAATVRPDVIVLDLGLPDIDGWDVIRRLRSGRTTRTIPVIVLTGHAEDEPRRRALEAGVDVYLVKPCLPDLMLKTIRDYLEREPCPLPHRDSLLDS